MKVTDLKSFILKSQMKYGNIFDYSKSIYFKNKEPIIIICLLHGEFISTPKGHLALKSKGGCAKCHPNAKLNQQEYIDRCNIIFNYYYDYSNLIYINMREKILIICPEHGKFLQKALSHIQGHGCQDCFDHNKTTFDDFVLRGNLKHNDKYKYLSIIDNMATIICPEHGSFIQNIFNHLNGNGCLQCFRDKDIFTTKICIEKSINTHGPKYNYSKTIYQKNNIDIVIICNLHGEFKQLPSHHWNGSGCPACARSVSQIEIEWLDSLKIDNNQRQISIFIDNKLFKTDAFNKDTNTIYEFYGDFWHGNPNKYKSEDINMVNHKTFGELYQKTIERENILKANGYKLITIWESDFIHANNKPIF